MEDFEATVKYLEEGDVENREEKGVVIGMRSCICRR